MLDCLIQDLKADFHLNPDFRNNFENVNTYTPGVLFVGHRPIVQTQIRRRTRRRLIRVSTVCLHNVLLKFK